MEAFLKNLEKVIGLAKASKDSAGKLLEENLELIFQDLSLMHADYAAHLHKLHQDYLKIPHSPALLNEIIVGLREKMIYLRNQAREMDTSFNKDNLPGLRNEVLNFLSAVQQYISATSGIFLNHEEIATDILDHMNESAFIMKEQYKFKYPSVSMKYEFRNETGKLIGDDLGYKLFLVEKALSKQWEQLSLAFKNCRRHN